jgi:hypothetical protein
MNLLVALIFFTILILLVTLVLALLSSLGVALIGWIVSLAFPLSIFEGAILSLVASLGIGYTLLRLIAMTSLPWKSFDEDDYEDEEDLYEDDEWEPPVVPRCQQQPAKAPPKPEPTKRKQSRRH